MRNMYDEELDENGEKLPYDSISPRPPLEDPNTVGIKQEFSGRPAVVGKITERVAPKMEPSEELQGLDAAMGIDRDAEAAKNLRESLLERDSIANIAQGMTSLSRGVNAPVENEKLYANLAQQGKRQGDLLSDEVTRKQRVKDAIANRALREQEAKTAAENRGLRQQEINAYRQNSRFERMDAREQARQDRLEREAKLGTKETEAITDFDNALELIGQIKSQKPDIDTGPISAAQSGIAGTFGVDDSKKSGFKAQVQDQLAAYINSLSGAGVSDKERAFLIQNLPTMSDNDDTFSAKLKIVEDRLAMKRKNMLGNLGKIGKNVEPFMQGGVPSGDEPSSSPLTSKYKPGQKLKIKGVWMKVGPDGNSLIKADE